MSVRRQNFGTLSSGETVSVYIIEAGDYSASWTDYGASWLGMMVPDSRGIKDDVLLGHSTLAGYTSDKAYFGSTIGRFANRISGGHFRLAGTDYRLSINNGPNHLHGGIGSFSHKVWDTEVGTRGESDTLSFYLTSPDKEEGYPGNLEVKVTILLYPSGRLRIEYSAISDRATPVNLTNHAYFNLAGQGRGQIYDHELSISALQYLEADETLIPLAGEPRLVDGTRYDFRKPKLLGTCLAGPSAALGYDTCFILDSGVREQAAATLFHPPSGRRLVTRTSMPGLQLYTANHFVDKIGKSGRTYARHSAVCLETEYFPDTPNRPDFPDCTAKPGIPWESWTEYVFSREKYR